MEGLEDELDFWNEFFALVEEWQGYGGVLEAHEGETFKQDIMFVEMGHEEAQTMKNFSPRMERAQMESEVQVGMVVSKKIQHEKELMKERKPRCKMNLHGGRVAWFM